MSDKILRRLFGYALRSGVEYQDGRVSKAPLLVFADADYEVGDGSCGLKEDGKQCNEPTIVYARADALIDAHTRIRELEAEIAAREAKGVRVKPLEWQDWSARHRTNYTAETPFGRYGVMQFHFPDMHFKIEPPSGKPVIAASLDAAKAAAQSDYERRILSALEPAPVTPQNYMVCAADITDEQAEKIAEMARGNRPMLIPATAPVTPAEAARVLLDAMGPRDEIDEGVMDLFFSGSPFTALRALADAGEAG